jgi:hypothetical protein
MVAVVRDSGVTSTTNSFYIMGPFDKQFSFPFILIRSLSHLTSIFFLFPPVQTQQVLRPAQSALPFGSRLGASRSPNPTTTQYKQSHDEFADDEDEFATNRAPPPWRFPRWLRLPQASWRCPSRRSPAVMKFSKMARTPFSFLALLVSEFSFSSVWI